MKTAILPQVRVDPKLRSDLESVLHDGETLSEFLESTVRSAVEYRRTQNEFNARADAAWMDFQRSGVAHAAEAVHAELRTKLEARRTQLQGKHRPASK